MKSKRMFLFRSLTVLILLLIAGAMFIVGRGHTLYLDNKAIEYNGQSYDALYKVAIYVDDEQVAKLYEKERGMATCMGQTFQMVLEITPVKGGDEVVQRATLPVPYNMDGIVLNLPALLAGLPQEAYLSEFVSAIVEEPVEEEIVTDEFALPAEEALPVE